MVKSVIKKGLVVGLALAKLTKDEAARTVRFLVKRGGVSQKEGTRLIKQINKEANAEKQKIRRMVKQKMLTDKELSALKKEVSQLEKSLRSAARTGRKVAGSAYRRLRK